MAPCNRNRFGDIWFRARHNALANEVAAADYKNRLNWLDFILALLIVAPLVATLLVKEQLLCNTLSIYISVIGTFGALLISLVGLFRDWRESYNNHRRAHAVFNNIAQKARRGENELDDREVSYLLRSLEEMFETAKFNFSEPSDKHYNRGLCRMANMPRWPFGLDVEKHKETKTSIWMFIKKCIDLRNGMSKELDKQRLETILAKARFYDSLSFEEVHKNWCTDFVFAGKKVLDIGCGSGRDSRYMSSKGAEVTAVDKSRHFIEYCKNNTNDPKIVWIEDALPEIKKISKFEHQFDLILVSAVLMFLNKKEQLESVKKLVPLLAPKGRMVITFKTSTSETDIFEFNEEVLTYIGTSGLTLSVVDGGADVIKRDVHWTIYDFFK